jgi:type II secretory pathway pseudopilin PulG
MEMTRPTRRRCRPREEGYILLAVMFMLVILIISLSVAAPMIKKEIQRDRDVETMQRGKQYMRAIKLYYKKFGSYPPNVDALVKTNNIRFLRKKYVDPTTGKDEWRPIRFGQNKVPTAMGFFGQPLAGSTLAGIGPSGGNGLNGASGNGVNGSPGSSTLFNSNGSGTSDTSSTDAGTSPGSAAGTTGNSTTSSTGSGGTDANGNPIAGTGSGLSGTGTGLTGQSFGGGGIIGFAPGSPKQSILVYKKKNHYNEWEFTYDPLQDQQTMQGGNTSNSGINGQPAGSSSGGFGSSTSGFGNSGFGGTGIGGNNSGGTTPISPQ